MNLKMDLDLDQSQDLRPDLGKGIGILDEKYQGLNVVVAVGHAI